MTREENIHLCRETLTVLDNGGFDSAWFIVTAEKLQGALPAIQARIDEIQDHRFILVIRDGCFVIGRRRNGNMIQHAPDLEPARSALRVEVQRCLDHLQDSQTVEAADLMPMFMASQRQIKETLKELTPKVRRERGFSVNPWSTHTRFLVSHRLLIDETYAGPLRDLLGTFRSGSLFILDEAHHAAPSSGQKYAIDSQITRRIRELAPLFEHRLFLSATPQNGHSNSFSALLEILDPQRFCRGLPVTAKHRDEVIVRRLKQDIREIQGGFPKRNVVQVTIDGLPTDAPELKLASLLDQYRELREERLRDETKRKQAASGLLIVGLQQRLLSSVEAFARTLKVHRKTVQRQWEKMQDEAQADDSSTGSLDLLSGLVGNDDDRLTLDEDQLQAEEDSQFEAASAATMGPIEDLSAEDLFTREQILLQEMTNIAEDARGKPDARVKRLIEWMRESMCPDLGKSGAQWNNTRVLIFTEYDDTKRYLVQQLQAALAGSDDADRRIEIFHGPTPPQKRDDIKRAFNADPTKHPVRILVATDAAREGLNLQAHCSNLFHFDVPWNPSRMEQRNGRGDRYPN